MWAILKAAWHDLSASGRAVVLVVLILACAGLLGAAMWLGYNLDWVPRIIDKAVSWRFQPIALL